MSFASTADESKSKASKLIGLLRNCIDELEGKCEQDPKQQSLSTMNIGLSPIFNLTLVALQEYTIEQMHGIQMKIDALQEEHRVEHEKVTFLRQQRQQEELHQQQRHAQNQTTGPNNSLQSPSSSTTNTKKLPDPRKTDFLATPPASSPSITTQKAPAADTSPAMTTQHLTPTTNVKTTNPTASTYLTPSSLSPASASSLTPLEQQKRAAMEKRRQEVLEQRRKAAAEQKRKEQEQKRKFLEYEQRKEDLKIKAAHQAAEQKRRAQQKEQELLRKQQQQHQKFLQQQKTQQKPSSSSIKSNHPAKSSISSPPNGHPSSAASENSSKSWWSPPHAPQASPSSTGRASPMNLMGVPNLPARDPVNSSTAVPNTTPIHPGAAAAAKAASLASIPPHTAAANTDKMEEKSKKPDKDSSAQNVRMDGDNNNLDGTEDESPHTELKRQILFNWGLQAPRFQQLKAIPDLLCSIHTVYPPAFGVSAHAYFEGWSPIVTQDLRSSNTGAATSSWDAGRLKKAVRRVRFFLHPDKLPKDLNRQQSFLCKLLWDVTNDAYEEFKKQEEGPSLIQL